MKTLYIIPIVAGLLSSSIFTSCNSFLDVKIKGKIESDVMFSDIQGYHDAMYGAYSSMASENLYGDNLGFGFVDRLGQMFAKNDQANVDAEITKYNYAHTKVRSQIDEIWKELYTTISYFNNIIEEAEKTSLTSNDVKVIRGEAYGARAFLHFDLLRLFTPKYTPNIATQRGIPYSTTFNLENKPVLTLEESYASVLRDLDKAEEILSDDKDVAVEEVPSSDYQKGRVAMFNLYAVYATKARVYYAMGNATKAAEYAKKVIDAPNFELIDPNHFDSVKTFPAGKELIFGLYNKKLSTTYSSYFLSEDGRYNISQYVEPRRDLADLYEVESSGSVSGEDKRFNSFYESGGLNGNGSSYHFKRFLNTYVNKKNEADVKGIQGVNLIRLPEMYYILSESLYDTNREEAIRILNLVRKSRGLTDITSDKTDTKEHFEEEMIRERMREMPGEGQVFYALKYYNRPFTTVKEEPVEPSNEIFVLPWPNVELEFGSGFGK